MFIGAVLETGEYQYKKQRSFRQRVMEFLLMNYTNFHLILHRFQVIANYW